MTVVGQLTRRAKKKKLLLLQGETGNQLALLLCRNLSQLAIVETSQRRNLFPIILFVTVLKKLQGGGRQEIKLGVRKCATNVISVSTSVTASAAIILFIISKLNFANLSSAHSRPSFNFALFAHQVSVKKIQFVQHTDISVIS